MRQFSVRPEKTKGPGRRGSRLIPALVAVSGFPMFLAILTGCSTLQPTMPAEPDPIRYIPSGASLYARFTKPAIQDIAPSLIPSGLSRSIAPILERTRVAAVGTSPAGAIGTKYDLAMVGEYTKNSVEFALSFDASFRREGGSFVSDASGIEVACPADRLILVRSPGSPDAPKRGGTGVYTDTASPDSLAHRMEFFDPQGLSPLPERFGSTDEADILIWIPDPLTAFASYLPSEGFDIPIQGIRILANRLDSADLRGSRLYTSSLSFVMNDSESARIYRPTLKFAWFALSGALMSENSLGPTSADVRFVLENENYVARGIMIPASVYSTLFRMSASGESPER